MKRALRALPAVLGLALLALASALVVLPASWLARLLPEDSLFTMVATEGTLWQGQALVALGSPHYRRTIPAPVRWRLSWAQGWPQLQLQHPWLAGPLWLRADLDGIRLSAQSLSLPASTLSLLHQGIRLAGPQGTLHAQWPVLPLSHAPTPGDPLLTLTWKHAASSLTSVRPLGDYQIAVQQGSTGPALILRTLQGPLTLTGQGHLERGQLRFKGQAAVSDQASITTQAALLPLLQSFGPVRNGQTPLHFQ